MADPLNNSEIEDVLSSIRRLVSEDKNDRPRPAQPPLGKLILTPALRVTEPESERPAPVNQDAVVVSASPPPFQIQGEVYDRLAPIDEEVLQDLVRELMSEELQGPFGERITRNIRKVVRAEIARALAAKELD